MPRSQPARRRQHRIYPARRLLVPEVATGHYQRGRRNPRPPDPPAFLAAVYRVGCFCAFLHRNRLLLLGPWRWLRGKQPQLGPPRHPSSPKKTPRSRCSPARHQRSSDHEKWLPGEFIRVLYFPYDPREGHQTLSQIEGSLDLIELHLIMKYNPPRNKHWRTPLPHQFCIPNLAPAQNEKLYEIFEQNQACSSSWSDLCRARSRASSRKAFNHSVLRTRSNIPIFRALC